MNPPSVEVVEVGKLSPGFQGIFESTSVKVRFNGFADLPVTKGNDECVKSPKFSCMGRTWKVIVYPGGDKDAEEGEISIYLGLYSREGIKIDFSIVMPGVELYCIAHLGDRAFYEKRRVRGFPNYATRSDILNNLVDGSLVVEVHMKLVGPKGREPIAFLPENPSACKTIRDKFMDEETSDVVFEVDYQRGGDNARKRLKNTPTKFHAHRFILPSALAELCGSGGSETSQTVPIIDVKPDIFRLLLSYLYGMEVDSDGMMSYTKELIDAADRYGVVNLKLQAEACLVYSTPIEIDNVMDHLLYSDAKNCALLKEAALDFVVGNKDEVIKKGILKVNAPEGLAHEILAAMSVGKGNNSKSGTKDLHTMRVSELRRMADEKGLEVDVPREALLRAIEGANVGATT